MQGGTGERGRLGGSGAGSKGSGEARRVQGVREMLRGLGGSGAARRARWVRGRLGGSGGCSEGSEGPGQARRVRGRLVGLGAGFVDPGQALWIRGMLGGLCGSGGCSLGSVGAVGLSTALRARPSGGSAPAGGGWGGSARPGGAAARPLRSAPWPGEAEAPDPGSSGQLRAAPGAAQPRGGGSSAQPPPGARGSPGVPPAARGGGRASGTTVALRGLARLGSARPGRLGVLGAGRAGGGPGAGTVHRGRACGGSRSRTGPSFLPRGLGAPPGMLRAGSGESRPGFPGRDSPWSLTARGICGDWVPQGCARGGGGPPWLSPAGDAGASS